MPFLQWQRGNMHAGLSTPATPLYIQEKIHPAAFVDSLVSNPSRLPILEDFNNLPEGAAYEWYKHKGNWQNRIIRGESCHVIASLVEKEGMAGKVKMIFYDPPYGIGFRSNMQSSTRSRQSGANDQTKDIPNDPTLLKAFRDTYTNSIHSYLDNIYKMARYSRELLVPGGSFFMQIGAQNVHRIAIVLDEVFGCENSIATIPFMKAGTTASKTLPIVSDFLLWYTTDRILAKEFYYPYYEPLTRKELVQYLSSYSAIERSDKSERPLEPSERDDPSTIPDGERIFQRMRLQSPKSTDSERSQPYLWKNVLYHTNPGEQWRVSREGLQNLERKERLTAADSGGGLTWKRYEDEIPGKMINNLWSSMMSANDLHYVVETAESVIERCMLMTTTPGDLVFDPTCGSGTTAFVAEKWGRRWITSDCSTVAVSLTRQRLSTGIFDYYLLQDSREGAIMEAKLSSTTTQAIRAESEYGDDPAGDFVYRRTPKVSAGILANNLEKQTDPTLLQNQPMKKRNTIRVSSPFTVEGHSPYQYIAPVKMNEIPDSTVQQSLRDYHHSIVHALCTSGVRDGEQRLTVEQVEPWPHSDNAAISKNVKQSLITHIACTSQGKVAIAIAPDDCTVPARYIDLVCEDAVLHPSIKLVLVIAFKFEAEATRERSEARGRLTVIKAQANRDLQIGNLKDEQSDSAFVRIGDPDVQVEDDPDNPDFIVVEVLGYDTYDPATGQLRTGEASDIDCWMIDAEYDGKSFYAHRIHFPGKGSDKQIKRFKRGLGDRIDHKLWTAMLTTRSAPLPRPKTGRIAVRIITNTHTELTTVLDVPPKPVEGSGY